MKYIICTICMLFLFAIPGFSQIDIFDKAKKTVEEELGKDKKAEEEKKEPTETKDEETKSGSETTSTEANNSPEKSSLKSYSRFDFVPGEKIIFFDDFSQDNVGDFPQRWNTNGTGEVVTLNNFSGKWFKLKNMTTFLPYFATNTYGQNFTIEFDLIVNVEEGAYPGALYLDLYNAQSPDEVPQTSSGPFAPGAFLEISLNPNGASQYAIHNVFAENGTTKSGGINNQVQDDAFLMDKINRVSIAVNKQRYRLYMNDKKVFDLPRLMDANENYNGISFRTWSWNENLDYQLLIGNFRIAEGQPATQSQLVTEGRFVTRGILFDSGSDKIKPESYGTLKEIAGVLKENSGIKVQIIGHTDSDGEDNSNMDLSQRRAASVKNALSNEFGIEAARLEAAGKGESEPAGPNDSAEGKANNRRVEFVKL